MGVLLCWSGFQWQGFTPHCSKDLRSYEIMHIFFSAWNSYPSLVWDGKALFKNAHYPPPPSPFVSQLPALGEKQCLLLLVASADRRISLWNADWQRDLCQLVDWLTFPGPPTAPDGTRLKKGSQVQWCVCVCCVRPSRKWEEPRVWE